MNQLDSRWNAITIFAIVILQGFARLYGAAQSTHFINQEVVMFLPNVNLEAGH